MAPARRPDLVLTGPMGSGKTSVGRQVAAWLEASFDDLDARIERETGETVPELFRRGEEHFRAAEERAARRWLDETSERPRVLALGGGTLQSTPLADAFATEATLVHLDAGAQELAARLGGDARRARPLLAGIADPVARLEELRRQRAGGYARAALRIDTSGFGSAGVALVLLRALHAAPQGPWAEAVRPVAPELDASVTWGRGALPLPGAHALVLLVDSALPLEQRRGLVAQIRESGGCEPLLIERAGGEEAKSPESLVDAWRALREAGADKDTTLLVVGGGTLTDLGGFVAHTYKRGMPLVLAPTTLLAQLDAALGGKNGVNLDHTKNALGTIRLPDGVHLDPLYLLTLEDVDLRGGLSEAVKSALVGDPDLLELIEAGLPRLQARALPVLEEVAARAAAVKLGVVARDLHESGERMHLNLGHTLGHAIEAVGAACGAPCAHGDAVAIGMVFAAGLARRVGLLEGGAFEERLVAVLDGLGLPTRLPRALAGEEAALLTAMAQDKKRRRGEIVWVLPEGVGRLQRRTVAKEDLRGALREALERSA